MDFRAPQKGAQPATIRRPEYKVRVEPIYSLRLLMYNSMSFKKNKVRNQNYASLSSEVEEETG